MKKGFRIISVLLTASVLTSEAGMAFASDLTDDYSASEFSGELFMEASEEEMFDEVPVEAGDAAPEIFIEDGDFLEESEHTCVALHIAFVVGVCSGAYYLDGSVIKIRFDDVVCTGRAVTIMR